MLEIIRGFWERLRASAAARDSSVMMVSTMGVQALALVLSITLARMLGDVGYGTVILAITVVQTVITLLDIRTSDAVIRFVGEAITQGRPRRAFTFFVVALAADLLLMLVTMLVMFGGAGLIFRLYPGGEVLRPLAMTYAWVIPFLTVANSFGAVLIVFKEFRAYAIATLARSLLTLVVALMLAPHGINAVMWAYVVGEGGTFLLMVILATRLLRRHIPEWQLENPRAALREFLPFAFHTTLTETLKGIFANITILVLGGLRPPAEVSYFKVAQSAVSLTALVITPVRLVLYPRINEAWASDDLPQVRRYIRQMALYGGGVSIAAGIAWLILARPLLALLYGADFTPAAPLIWVLALGYVADNALLWMRPVVLAAGKANILTALSTVTALVRTVATVLLVLVFGVMGAALAFLLAMMVHAGFGLFSILPALDRWYQAGLTAEEQTA